MIKPDYEMDELVLLFERQRQSLGLLTSDVVQASPFYTVVSAARSQFCCKECRWRAGVRGSYGRCHTDRKIETPLSLFLVSVSLNNTSTKRQKLVLAGPVGPVPCLSREGRAPHTQHAKHTAGNTHRHRRAWGRGLENLAREPSPSSCRRRQQGARSSRAR